MSESAAVRECARVVGACTEANKKKERKKEEKNTEKNKQMG